MKTILEQLVNDLMITDYCHKRICPEMEQKAEVKITAMNTWIDQMFPEQEKSHEATKIIWDAFSAGQEWMLACGIVMGLSLMGETVRSGR